MHTINSQQVRGKPLIGREKVFLKCCFKEIAAAFLIISLFGIRVFAESNSNQSRIIDGLTLIDAISSQEIRKIGNGEEINLSLLPTKGLNIRADVAVDVDRVVFGLNSISRFRAESARPFSLAGDSAGDYHSWTPKLGKLSIEVTAFKAGKTLETRRFNFTVVDAETDPSEVLVEGAKGKEAKVFDKLIKKEELRANFGGKYEPRKGVDSRAALSSVGKGNIEPQRGRHSRTFELFLRASGQNQNSVSSPSVAGTCVSILDNSLREISIVCSHNQANPVDGQLQLVQHPARQTRENDVLCDLGEPSSPVVKSCLLKEEDFAAVSIKGAEVRISLNTEPQSELVGRIPAEAGKP